MSITKEMLSSTEKSVILNNFTHQIRKWFILGVLPQKFVEDEDVIPYFTPCEGHRSSKDYSSDCDQIDGPNQMRAYCQLCKKEKDIAAGSTSAYSRPISPYDNTRVINPLSIDWSMEEEEENREIAELFSDNTGSELKSSSYSPVEFCY